MTEPTTLTADGPYVLLVGVRDAEGFASVKMETSPDMSRADAAELMAWMVNQLEPSRAAEAAAAERLRLLGYDPADGPPGILDHYTVVTAPNDAGKHIVFAHCARCHHVMVTARDLDGDQTGLTLSELTAQALDHEEETHAVEKLPTSAQDLYYAVNALATKESPLDVLARYITGPFAAAPADIRAVKELIERHDMPRWTREHALSPFYSGDVPAVVKFKVHRDGGHLKVRVWIGQEGSPGHLGELTMRRADWQRFHDLILNGSAAAASKVSVELHSDALAMLDHQAGGAS